MGFSSTGASRMNEMYYPLVGRSTSTTETLYIIGFVESSATLVLQLAKYIIIPVESFKASEADCLGDLFINHKFCSLVAMWIVLFTSALISLNLM